MKQFEEIEGITLEKLSFQSKAEAFGFLEGDMSVRTGSLGSFGFLLLFYRHDPSGSSGVWLFTNKTRSHVQPRCMEGKRGIVDVRLPSSIEAPNGQLVHVPAFLLH